jgi:hypothetical protein
MEEKNFLEKKEATFLDLALEYKRQYDETPWWRFLARKHYNDLRKSAIDCMIRYGK